jgi:hypothetical protein
VIAAAALRSDPVAAPRSSRGAIPRPARRVQVKRCDEMARKLRFFKDQVRDGHTQLLTPP